MDVEQFPACTAVGILINVDVGQVVFTAGKTFSFELSNLVCKMALWVVIPGKQNHRHIWSRDHL